jgi:hypothetical protein
MNALHHYRTSLDYNILDIMKRFAETNHIMCNMASKNFFSYKYMLNKKEFY